MTVAGTGGRDRGAAGGDPVLEDTAQGRAQARKNLVDIAMDPNADTALTDEARAALSLFN